MTSPQQSAPVDAVAEAQLPAQPQQEKGLRLWPAALLFIALAVTRLAAYFMDDLPPSLYPVVFFGPLLATIAIALWWLFASRSRYRDRWLGFLLLAAAGAASFSCSHYTVKGMVFMFYTVPITAGVFLLTLFLFARLGRVVAAWVAVAVAVVCLGGSVLARSNGFTGDFRASFDWRWKPSPEDEYLANRNLKMQVHEATSFKAPADIGTVQWAEFRGPKRDGSVPGLRLDEDWAARPPKQLWRHKIGPGWSSFAVTSKLLYTQEQRDDSEAVVCLDADTGSEVWSFVYPSRFYEAIAGPGPRGTPTLHDGALFTLGADGVLCRLDARTGALAWTHDLRVDADRKPPIWGFSSSPLVANGLVIVHAGGANDKGILAYDEKTGELRWGAAAGDHGYSSPHLATILGRPCVLVMTNTGISAHDPLTGKPQWEHAWKCDTYRAIQPLVIGEASVVLGTGPGAGTRRIDLKKDAGATTVTERWTSLAIKPGFDDYVAHRGHLFGFDNNIFACIDLETGTRKWKEGRYGNGQVVLLPDADQLLVTSETGDLILLRANPDRHQELARISALTGKTWNHPVLVGNRVYLRNGEEAACYELPVRDSHAAAASRPY